MDANNAHNLKTNPYRRDRHDTRRRSRDYVNQSYFLNFNSVQERINIPGIRPSDNLQLHFQNGPVVNSRELWQISTQTNFARAADELKQIVNNRSVSLQSTSHHVGSRLPARGGSQRLTTVMLPTGDLTPITSSTHEIFTDILPSTTDSSGIFYFHTKMGGIEAPFRAPSRSAQFSSSNSRCFYFIPKADNSPDITMIDNSNLPLLHPEILDQLEDGLQKKAARRWPTMPTLITFNIKSLGGIPENSDTRDTIAELMLWKLDVCKAGRKVLYNKSPARLQRLTTMTTTTVNGVSSIYGVPPHYPVSRLYDSKLDYKDDSLDMLSQRIRISSDFVTVSADGSYIYLHRASNLNDQGQNVRRGQGRVFYSEIELSITTWIQTAVALVRSGYAPIDLLKLLHTMESRTASFVTMDTENQKENLTSCTSSDFDPSADSDEDFYA